jgi:hypothetical protein
LRFGFFEADGGGAAVAAGGSEEEEKGAGEAAAESGFEEGSGEGAAEEGGEVEVIWAEMGERADIRREGMEVEEGGRVEGEKEELAEGAGFVVLSDSTAVPLPFEGPAGRATSLPAVEIEVAVLNAVG